MGVLMVNIAWRENNTWLFTLSEKSPILEKPSFQGAETDVAVCSLRTQYLVTYSCSNMCKFNSLICVRSHSCLAVLNNLTVFCHLVKGLMLTYLTIPYQLTDLLKLNYLCIHLLVWLCLYSIFCMTNFSFHCWGSLLPEQSF